MGVVGCCICCISVGVGLSKSEKVVVLLGYDCREITMLSVEEFILVD